MFKQLSLFDSVLVAEPPRVGQAVATLPQREQRWAGKRELSGSLGAAAAAPGAKPAAIEPGEEQSVAGWTQRIERLEQRRIDEPRPLGDLARLVLARYDLLAERRAASERLRRERPRKSIRVLTPVGG